MANDSPSSSFEDSFSVISSGSMVEIKQNTESPNLGLGGSSPGASGSSRYEENMHRLVYSKSKVYVNPTAYSRDNIPGFVALVKREAVNPIYLLAWIPETLLSEKGTDEWDKFVKVEEKMGGLDAEDDDVVMIDLPVPRPESYAFSVPLTSIYSLVLYPPSLSSWYGSVVINLINGDTLPTLFFHDDESNSFTLPQKPIAINRNSATYPPPQPPSPSHNSWGGEDLLTRLRSFSHVLRSNLQPSLFLIDPSRADIEAHSTQIFPDDAVDDILAQSSYANSHSPVPAHRRPRPLSTPATPSSSSSASSSSTTPNPYSARTSILHKSLFPPSPSSSHPSSQARIALLQSFSNITRATRHAAQQILSHPLAQPIVPHLPDPVQSLVHAEWHSWVEKGGVGEYDSARNFLAKWARTVAEEGERARRREAQSVPVDTPNGGKNTEVVSELGIFELLHSAANLPTPTTSRCPGQPVDEKMWDGWFDEVGRPTVRIEFMRREVFCRGVSPKGTLRRRVWPYLLGVYEWDVTEEEREVEWAKKRHQYQEIKDEWCGNPEVFERSDILEERHRIDVDCRRTDRTHPLFSGPPSNDNDPVDDEKERLKRYSTISPNMSDIGAQSPTNEHIDLLSGVLLTYNLYEKKLGYVQGMSDLCAPIYVVMGGDEALTFWCFVEVMDRMKSNFYRDQSGMMKQLLTLQQLIKVMDPELFRHLEKVDGLNMFFCFRWVLIAFKREFSFDDILCLWENLWTDYYSNSFVLFIALAVLESHRDVILRYLVEFDEILKYCNELSMTIELETTLAQAEVLFLSFSQIVADIDRRAAEDLQPESNGLRKRAATSGMERSTSASSSSSSASASGTGNGVVEAAADATAAPVISENLRELLVNGR